MSDDNSFHTKRAITSLNGMKETIANCINANH